MPIPWLEAPSKTSAPQTRHFGERRKNKWRVRFKLLLPDVDAAIFEEE
jgi:hypothetical protein